MHIKSCRSTTCTEKLWYIVIDKEQRQTLNLLIESFSEYNRLTHMYFHLSPPNVHLNFKPSQPPAELCLSSSASLKRQRICRGCVQKNHSTASLPPISWAVFIFFKTPWWWNQTETLSNFCKAACVIGSTIKKQHFVCVWEGDMVDVSCSC